MIESRGTAAVILAAGASTRMSGSSKLLLPFAHRTILETVVARARAAELAPLIAVVGSPYDAVWRTLRSTPVRPDRVVVNRRSAEGIAGSVAAGVEAAMAEEVDSVAVLLADEPGIGVDSIRRVIAGFRRSLRAAVRAQYADRPGHPVVLSRSVFELVLGLPRAANVLRELSRAEHEVGIVQLHALAPIDVDTAEDYERALNRLAPAPPEPAGMLPDAVAPPGFPHR